MQEGLLGLNTLLISTGPNTANSAIADSVAYLKKVLIGAM